MALGMSTANAASLAARHISFACSFSRHQQRRLRRNAKDEHRSRYCNTLKPDLHALESGLLRAEPLTGGNPRRRPRTAISSQSSAAEASEWNILDSPGLTPPPRQLPRTDPLARLGCALQRALAPIFPPLASTELVRRMAVTLCMLWLIRVGHYLPIPGLDPLLTSSSGTALSFAHFLSGSREVPGNIYLLSITPYITAGFALAAFQLLPEARLHFKRLREEGRHGQERITGYLSVLFVLAALTQAIAESSRLAAAGVLAGGATGWGAKAGVAVNLMAGAVLCKWAVQTVDSWGLGDGTGVVIGAGIALSYSQAVVSIGAALSAAPPPPGPLLTALGLCFCLVAIVVYVQGIELRLPLTFYSARRGTARASHPVLAKLSGGVDSSSAVELQTLFPMRLSPSGTRQLLFANFWVGLLQAPLSKIGLAGVLGNPWVFAALVFVLEAVSFADATPKQMAEFLALSDAGVRGKSPGIDTERFLALRRSQLKLLNAAFMAGVSLAAVAVDKACTALIGLPLGCLNILLLVSTVLGGARQVDVLTQGAKVDKVIAEEYAVLEQVAQRSR